MRTLFSILLLCLVLGACAPKTTVVLVPDDDGGVGRVVVKAGGAEQPLAAANESTQVTDKPAPPKVMSQQEIDRIFGSTVAAMPEPPKSFLLYCPTGSTEPEPASRPALDEAAADITRRAVSNVSVIGHSDSAGDPAANQKLSMARAEAVRRMLEARGVPASGVALSGHGANDPLVPTAPGVAEARNRRVEILVR